MGGTIAGSIGDAKYWIIGIGRHLQCSPMGGHLEDTPTNYVITVGTFTVNFVRAGVIIFTAGSKAGGAQLGDKLAVLNVFTTDSAYDPIVKTV